MDVMGRLKVSAFHFLGVDKVMVLTVICKKVKRKIFLLLFFF